MKIISTGAFIAALGIVFGAFGAHALRGKIEDYLFDVFTTANQYLMITAFGIILYGLWHHQINHKNVRAWPVLCFLIGIFIFSGSLYAITFSSIRMFGAITPIGGILLIAGWIGFGIQAQNNTERKS